MNRELIEKKVWNIERLLDRVNAQTGTPTDSLVLSRIGWGWGKVHDDWASTDAQPIDRLYRALFWGKIPQSWEEVWDRLSDL